MASGLPSVQPLTNMMMRAYARPQFSASRERGAVATGATPRPGQAFVVSISSEALELSRAESMQAEEISGPVAEAEGRPEGAPPTEGAQAQGAEESRQEPKPLETRGLDGQPLSEEEQREVEKLESRDREVRQHEMAHEIALGQYARGGPRYQYELGPDGERYIVGGQVAVDESPEPTPEATIRKAETIRRAALAPASPSAQDRKVAAAAARMEQNARMEELAEDRAKQTEQRARQAEQGQVEAGGAEQEQAAQSVAEFQPASFSPNGGIPVGRMDTEPPTAWSDEELEEPQRELFTV